ncbi:MAG: LptF/LptG family permease [Alphaproteobacteria bacterium]|nr:LptF/LptG family permease [Alphaproteobacteria bacterium]
MKILPIYIAKQYIKWFLVILVGLLSIVFIFDVIELMRRTSVKPDVTYGIVLTMAFLNLPDIGQKILPFIALFSSMLTLWRLTRTQELIIVRAIGVSVWQFLFPILLCTFCLSIFYLCVVNPLGALMKKSYQELEQHYIDRSALLDLSSAGLWLRQANADGNILLHADSVTLNPLMIKPLIAFMYDKDNNYLGRIDAQEAILDKNQWVIVNGWFNWKNKLPEPLTIHYLPTDLTVDKIQESMASPNTVSFWELPSFITSLEATGFPGTRHRMLYYSLLAQPMFLCAMVFFAACFSLGMARQGGAFMTALGGLCVGSFAFGFNDVVYTLGANQSLPTLLAAFAVPLIALSAGTTALLHLEDG